MKLRTSKATKNQFISSSRAAQLSGYSRDYIGQLCRNGRVDCERINGEWSVDLNSVLAYKQRFATTEDSNNNESDNYLGDLVEAGNSEEVSNLNDRFIATVEAAKLTGYSQDYIGQLARSGAVDAEKRGRRWFIERGALIRHKKHNDAQQLVDHHYAFCVL
jgi:hypothetical protein